MAFILISLIWPISIICIKSCLTLVWALCTTKNTTSETEKIYVAFSMNAELNSALIERQSKYRAKLWLTGSLEVWPHLQYR